MPLRDYLSFSYPKRLPVEFGGGWMRVVPRADARILKPGWDAAAFDLQLVARKCLEPGMNVWDIGANQGIFSMLAAWRVGITGTVHALEADPYYAALIARTAERGSPPYRGIRVLCGAIADRRDVLEFAISAQGHARNRLAEFGEGEFAEASRRQVLSIRGDDLLTHWPAPHFVKMDVEGAELAALSGCRTLLAEARPVFYIEISPQNADSVAALFSGAGYDLFHLEGDGSETPVTRGTLYTIARPR